MASDVGVRAHVSAPPGERAGVAAA
jgi:hypothetical protein